jgi:hypothetical protein
VGVVIIARPWWWRPLWIYVIVATIILGIFNYIFLHFPLDKVFTYVIITFILIGFAYYIRIRPSRRINRAIYILLGITPIGFFIWVAYALLVARYVNEIFGPNASLVITIIIYVLGAYIGDKIGKWRNYELPMTP